VATYIGTMREKDVSAMITRMCLWLRLKNAYVKNRIFLK